MVVDILSREELDIYTRFLVTTDGDRHGVIRFGERALISKQESKSWPGFQDRDMVEYTYCMEYLRSTCTSSRGI